MCSFVAKRISSHFFSPSSLHYHHLALPNSLLQRYLSSQNQPHKELPFIAEYLISSFGFSTDRALKVSADRNLSPIKSSDRPDSVVQFLRETGLSDTQIKDVVSFQPVILASNVEKTLKPKVHQLIEGGFSGQLLVHLIRNNPSALLLEDTLSRLLFWRDFIGERDEALLRIIKKNRSLIILDIDEQIVPKVNLLKEYGLSNQNIVRLLEHGYSFMHKNLDSLRQILELLEELGLQRGEGMFLWGFKMLYIVNKDEIERKVEFYKRTYGWSQEEVYSASRKHPGILAYPVNKIKSKMDFLIGKVKLEPRSIASQPMLLSFSLEKRLVPRHHVLSILASKIGTEASCGEHLLTACHGSEKRFLEKYVEPYKKDVPGLAEAYFAAVGENVSV